MYSVSLVANDTNIMLNNFHLNTDASFRLNFLAIVSIVQG